MAALLLAANLILIGQEVPDVIEETRLSPDYLAFYLPYNGAILLCYAVMVVAPRRIIAVAATAALLAVYLVVTLAQRV